MNRLSIFLLIVLSVCSVWAQRHNQIDPADLDYDTNLVVPEIPAKQVAAIRQHMNSIQETLNHMGFKTERNRDQEVLTVIIPCSEMFAPNDTVLKPAAKTRLDQLVKFLRYPTMYKIVIGVFTDNTGEMQYCDHLSETRANAIDDYFISVARQNGFGNINVIPYGLGQANPRQTNSTIENRAENRRVEIHIIPEWQMIETAKAGKLK